MLQCVRCADGILYLYQALRLNHLCRLGSLASKSLSLSLSSCSGAEGTAACELLVADELLVHTIGEEVGGAEKAMQYMSDESLSRCHTI